MIDVPIIFETNSYWVINKPAGLTVHPGAGAQTTLTDIWSQRFPAWAKLAWLMSERPGIVHRLDKDTSGVMLIAKDPDSLTKLPQLFADRQTTKEYRALVVGECPQNEFTVEASVSRDSDDRQKQSTSLIDLPWETAGKEAVTDFKVVSIYRLKKYVLSELLCFPKTGRMHQIRVHLKLKNLPIAGDAKYANKLARHFNKEYGVNRQMLHAEQLAFIDPWTNKEVEYTAHSPEDFQELLSLIKK